MFNKVKLPLHLDVVFDSLSYQEHISHFRQLTYQASRRDKEAGVTGPVSERARRKRRWPEGQALRKTSWLWVWNPLSGSRGSSGKVRPSAHKQAHRGTGHSAEA